MSWIDQLNNVELEIQTGDGKKWSPLWKEAKRSKVYNTAAYDFIRVSGTFIYRGLPQGNQYDITLIFQGETHLTTAEQFNRSADDPRFWTITHPFWGSIKVQPMTLEEDKSVLNSTIFKIKIWETISTKYPVQKQLANDRVSEMQLLTNEMVAKSFANQIPVIATSLRTTLTDTVKAVDQISSKAIKTDSEFAKFKTKVAKAQRLITDTIQKPIDVMRSVIDLINYPVYVVGSVTDRLNIAKELATKLEAILLKKRTKTTLLVYECAGSSLVSAMANAAMTPNEGDYSMRLKVLYAMDTVQEQYVNYLTILDESQADRSDEVDGFTPDDDTSRHLNEAVVEALANVYDYSFGAKQERAIYLEEDSNPILLTHRFYGLDNEDSNLDFFINTNSLSLGELFQIRKGRRILYYV